MLDGATSFSSSFFRKLGTMAAHLIGSTTCFGSPPVRWGLLDFMSASPPPPLLLLLPRDPSKWRRWFFSEKTNRTKPNPGISAVTGNSWGCQAEVAELCHKKTELWPWTTRAPVGLFAGDVWMFLWMVLDSKIFKISQTYLPNSI